LQPFELLCQFVGYLGAPLDKVGEWGAWLGYSRVEAGALLLDVGGDDAKFRVDFGQAVGRLNHLFGL